MRGVPLAEMNPVVMLSIATSGANASRPMPWWRRCNLGPTAPANCSVRFFGAEMGFRMTVTLMNFIGTAAKDLALQFDTYVGARSLMTTGQYHVT